MNRSVTVNGKNVHWQQVPNSVGLPVLELSIPSAETYKVVVEWQGNNLEKTQKISPSIGEKFQPKLI